MIISYVLRIMLDRVKTSVSQIVFALTEHRVPDCVLKVESLA